MTHHGNAGIGDTLHSLQGRFSAFHLDRMRTRLFHHPDS